MATLVYLATHGQDDPVRAALPFILAMGVVEAGEEAAVCLAADAVALMKDHISKAVHPPGWPPLEQLIATAVNCGVTIYVLPQLSGAIGVTADDLDGKRSTFTSAQAFASICRDAAQVISV